MSKSLITKAAAVAALSIVAVAGPASAYESATTVPGQQGRDGAVTGHYVTGWDDPVLGHCDAIVNYRGDFGGDAHLNDGWITNQIKCEDGTTASYLIVHESDPRYTGNPDRAIWGKWEIVKMTVKGNGNVANLNGPNFGAVTLGSI